MKNKIVTTLKKIYWFFASVLFPIKEGGVILAYHSIGDNEAFFTVSPTNFEKQLKFLRDNNWQVIPLTALVVLLQEQQEIPKKTVILTFDDAYIDFLENALPLLQKYQMPATLFVPTGLVGERMKNREGFELSVLSWDQLRQVAKHPLITIGSHTVTHPNLTEVTDVERIRFELQKSKEEIENTLGTVCSLCAYPKGKSNLLVQQETSAVYDSVVGTKDGRIIKGAINKYDLYRRGVYRYTTLSRFKLLLKR
jgi:peptidoglycan/xylan/chitin deacetylase (PgdA/CDA1 family)